MLETLTFSRNKHMLGRSPDDVLFLCTDTGYHVIMMILYIGKKEGDNLKLEFVFSIGNLNNESGNIPRNKLDIMERGTKQCEKILEWMSPQVSKKILIADAKIPLSWLKNKVLLCALSPMCKPEYITFVDYSRQMKHTTFEAETTLATWVLNLITLRMPTSC